MTNVDFNQLADDIIDRISSVAGSVSDAVDEASTGISRVRDFHSVGRDLANSQAVTTHGGNLSVSDGHQIWITKTGSQLRHLSADDIVMVEWQPTAADRIASMELVVHRAMYHALAARLSAQKIPFVSAAVVHTHSLHTTFRSFLGDMITPLDSEGTYVLGQSVAVFAVEQAIASEQVAQMMAELVSSGGSIAVVRGHGPFAIADSLKNAHRLVSSLEYSASLLTLFEQTGRNC